MHAFGSGNRRQGKHRRAADPWEGHLNFLFVLFCFLFLLRLWQPEFPVKCRPNNVILNEVLQIPVLMPNLANKTKQNKKQSSNVFLPHANLEK